MAIMEPMRRLLILIMIVLLPLRGWAGDLMGVQMATSGVASNVADAMPPGCPMHAQTGQAHSGPDTDAAPSHGSVENCASCGLCIPLAEFAGARLDLVAFANRVQPVLDDAEFVSAALAPSVKPPIF